jgi:multiple sugar transport system substrate-binding protein
MIDLGTVDGKFAGMPFNTSTPIVYYNAELVARAGGDPDNFPQDWDGLIALAAKIDALGDDLEGVFMGVHTQSDDWLWQALVYQAGGSLMDPTDTKVAFGDAAGLHGLTVARRLVAEGGMELSENQTGTQQFYAGKVGIIFQSTASLKATTDSVGQTFTLRTARYPLSNREAGGLPTGGNAAVILTTDAERAAAAWQFLKWVSGPRAQAIAISGSGYMPVNKRTVEKEFLGDLYDSQPNWRTSLEQIPVARKWYGYPGANAAKIIKAQKELQGLAMRGEIPVAEALARMVEETQALLPST